jgi:hypothetical protein
VSAGRTSCVHMMFFPWTVLMPDSNVHHSFAIRSKPDATVWNAMVNTSLPLASQDVPHRTCTLPPWQAKHVRRESSKLNKSRIVRYTLQRGTSSETLQWCQSAISKAPPSWSRNQCKRVPSQMNIRYNVSLATHMVRTQHQPA